MFIQRTAMTTDCWCREAFISVNLTIIIVKVCVLCIRYCCRINAWFVKRVTICIPIYVSLKIRTCITGTAGTHPAATVKLRYQHNIHRGFQNDHRVLSGRWVPTFWRDIPSHLNWHTLDILHGLILDKDTQHFRSWLCLHNWVQAWNSLCCNY
jgi:hypothetical protein